jgi:MoxR-like ATPase
MFLRGVQRTDAKGVAVFRTIYPGWYPGRTVHIHTMVHLGGNVVHTGQLYFADAVTDPSSSPPTPAEANERLEQALFEIRRVIAGQDAMLERVLVCLLAQGHLLIEGVPGLAKTLTIKTTAGVLGGSFARVQFTPDLVPSDLVGTRIYRPQAGTFDTELGPVFCNFLLADEINRAPAKVQSALLEVMQERQVTIGHETHPVPSPFLVMATQNPIESEGTYPLPEAQIDRFLLKVLIGYPQHDEELTVVQRQLVDHPELKQVLSLEDLAALQRAVADIYVDPSLVSYAVDIATATREPAEHGLPDLAQYISYGASPRGPISLVQGARALALIRGREYAIVEDLQALVRDALRHRLVLSYQALAEEVTPDSILDQVLAAVPTPQLDLARVSAA